MVLNNHFDLDLIKFLLRYVARYCDKFPFQPDKVRVEILNTRLGIYIKIPVINMSNYR